MLSKEPTLIVVSNSDWPCVRLRSGSTCPSARLSVRTSLPACLPAVPPACVIPSSQDPRTVYAPTAKAAGPRNLSRLHLVLHNSRLSQFQSASPVLHPKNFSFAFAPSLDACHLEHFLEREPLPALQRQPTCQSNSGSWCHCSPLSSRRSALPYPTSSHQSIVVGHCGSNQSPLIDTWADICLAATSEDRRYFDCEHLFALGPILTSGSNRSERLLVASITAIACLPCALCGQSC